FGWPAEDGGDLVRLPAHRLTAERLLPLADRGLEAAGVAAPDRASRVRRAAVSHHRMWWFSLAPIVPWRRAGCAGSGLADCADG
ncbi:hypothetical protein, partial [Streptomyces hainanensis]|uniref:hypothetical protein n=1 Tax=Streptomyces hainanensis TaxID=402648 RepID=UPI001A9EC049